jgi:hypothetical protein
MSRKFDFFICTQDGKVRKTFVETTFGLGNSLRCIISDAGQRLCYSIFFEDFDSEQEQKSVYKTILDVARNNFQHDLISDEALYKDIFTWNNLYRLSDIVWTESDYFFVTMSRTGDVIEKEQLALPAESKGDPPFHYVLEITHGDVSHSWYFDCNDKRCAELFKQAMKQVGACGTNWSSYKWA